MPSDRTDTAPGAPTLSDVAARAGVSTATVSRALNAPGQVTQATRTRVMQAVRDLGYAPNFGARALAARRTNTFGAVIPTMDNAIFARGLQAFQDTLREHGVTLLVASSSYKPEQEEDQIRTLITRGAEALLLIGHDRTEAAYALLDRQHIPYLVAWAWDEAAPRPCVGFDNRAAMQALTAEVIALGHRRLAVITADRAGNDRARARFQGVCAAMAAAGLDAGALLVEETPYSIANGATAFARLMDAHPPPTAVLCGNDVLAAGAVTQARALGIDVPGDVSVTGFDDIELAAILTPALTTVHVPHREMGRRAAQMLLDMRAGAAPPPGLRLDAGIAWRASLGPPPVAGGPG
ncbi:LacI family transcriptional regulator [Roseovarius sp. A46]|uniref:LacI family DNA-binding transcriptional regulator n=1 Tax=Roseovarius sp. A46 TaxID=2109331 RepID=UPI0010131818|nr:LacI family DNA-binding transcriptional regulator [Roseovarius sp. A46]RXV66379.1 LacI family transcriptional regulator [Roseovarius sp. A46]